MPEAFTVGPVLIPTPVAALVGAFLAAHWIASRLALRWEVNVRWIRNTADGTLLAGLAAARVVYVAMHWSAYAPAPWTALYFWQPGYLTVAGLVGGALYVLYRVRARSPRQRLPSLRAASIAFVAGATILAAVLGTMGWFSGPAAAGDKLPDFRLVNLAGEPVALSDLNGKGVVLNFWATWCPPCRREMPLLESVWKEYRSKGVVIVGINVGQSANVVRPFVHSRRLTYPIWTDAPAGKGEFDDTNELLTRYGGIGLPTTVFIGADGTIRKIHIGELSRAFLMQWLPALAPG